MSHFLLRKCHPKTFNRIKGYIENMHAIRFHNGIEVFKKHFKTKIHSCFIHPILTKSLTSLQLRIREHKQQSAESKCNYYIRTIQYLLYMHKRDFKLGIREFQRQQVLTEIREHPRIRQLVDENFLECWNEELMKLLQNPL